MSALLEPPDPQGVAPEHRDGVCAQTPLRGRGGQDDRTEDEGGAEEKEEKGDGRENVTAGAQVTNLKF